MRWQFTARPCLSNKKGENMAKSRDVKKDDKKKPQKSLKEKKLAKQEKKKASV